MKNGTSWHNEILSKGDNVRHSGQPIKTCQQRDKEILRTVWGQKIVSQTENFPNYGD